MLTAAPKPNTTIRVLALKNNYLSEGQCLPLKPLEPALLDALSLKPKKSKLKIELDGDPTIFAIEYPAESPVLSATFSGPSGTKSVQLSPLSEHMDIRRALRVALGKEYRVWRAGGQLQAARLK